MLLRLCDLDALSGSRGIRYHIYTAGPIEGRMEACLSSNHLHADTRLKCWSGDSYLAHAASLAPKLDATFRFVNCIHLSSAARAQLSTRQSFWLLLGSASYHRHFMAYGAFPPMPVR